MYILCIPSIGEKSTDRVDSQPQEWVLSSCISLVSLQHRTPTRHASSTSDLMSPSCSIPPDSTLNAPPCLSLDTALSLCSDFASPLGSPEVFALLSIQYRKAPLGLSVHKAPKLNYTIRPCTSSVCTCFKCVWLISIVIDTGYFRLKTSTPKLYLITCFQLQDHWRSLFIVFDTNIYNNNTGQPSVVNSVTTYEENASFAEMSYRMEPELDYGGVVKLIDLAAHWN